MRLPVVISTCLLLLAVDWAYGLTISERKGAVYSSAPCYAIGQENEYVREFIVRNPNFVILEVVDFDIPKCSDARLKIVYSGKTQSFCGEDIPSRLLSYSTNFKLSFTALTEKCGSFSLRYFYPSVFLRGKRLWLVQQEVILELGISELPEDTQADCDGEIGSRTFNKLLPSATAEIKNTFIISGKFVLEASCYLNEKKTGQDIGWIEVKETIAVLDDLNLIEIHKQPMVREVSLTGEQKTVVMRHSFVYPLTYHLILGETYELTLHQDADYTEDMMATRPNMTATFPIKPSYIDQLDPGRHPATLILENDLSSSNVSFQLDICEKITAIKIEEVEYVDVYPSTFSVYVQLEEGSPAFIEINLRSKANDEIAARAHGNCNNPEECKRVEITTSVKFEGVFTIDAKANNSLGEVSTSLGDVESFPLVHDVFLTSQNPILATEEAELVVLYKIANGEGQFEVQLKINGDSILDEKLESYKSWKSVQQDLTIPTVPFDPSNCNVYTKKYTFESSGRYEVRAKVLSKNKKQYKSHMVEVKVLDKEMKSCVSGIKIRDGNDGGTLSSSLEMNSDIELTVDVQTSCTIGDKADIKYQWQIFKIACLEQSINSSNIVQVKGVNLNENGLFVKKGILLAGLYTAKARVEIVPSKEQSMESYTDFVSFHVPMVNLKAGICGGSTIEIGANETSISFDSSCSYSKEVPDVKYSWFCVTSKNNLPTNEYEGTFRNQGSCFGWQPSFAGNDKVLSLPVNRTTMGNQIHVRLFLSHPSYAAGIADQHVVFLDRPAPLLRIRCWTNCEGILFPRETLILEMICATCVKYEWTTMLGQVDLFNSKKFCKVKSDFLQRMSQQFGEEISITGRGYDDTGHNASVQFVSRIHKPPKGIKCAAKPNSGIAYATKFTISCTSGEKMTFKFYLVNEDGDTLLQYGYGSSFTNAIFGPGKSSIRVEVCNLAESCSGDVTVSLEVKEGEQTSHEIMQDLENALTTGDAQKITQALAMIGPADLSKDLGQKIIDKALETKLTSTQSVQQLLSIIHGVTNDPRIAKLNQEAVSKKLSQIYTWLNGETDQASLPHERVARSSLKVTSDLISSLDDTEVSSSTSHLSTTKLIGDFARKMSHNLVPSEKAQTIATTAFTTTIKRFDGQEMSVLTKDVDVKFEGKDSNDITDLQVHRFKSSRTNFNTRSNKVDEVVGISLFKSVKRQGDRKITTEALPLPNNIEFALRNQRPLENPYTLKLNQSDLNTWEGEMAIAVTDSQHSMALKIRINSKDIAQEDSIKLTLTESNILSENRGMSVDVPVEDFVRENGFTWTIPLTAKTLHTLKIEVQKTSLVNDVTIDVLPYSVRCMRWDDTSTDWNDAGCKASRNSTLDEWTRCECDTAQTSGRSDIKKLMNPMLFSSKLIVYPNKIDLDKVSWNLWEEFLENPVILSTILGMYIFFGMLMIWAHRKDKNEFEKPSFIEIPNEAEQKYRYILTIFTGSRLKAGSTSNISVRILGTRKPSTTYCLQGGGANKLLARGSVVSFLLTSEHHLGDVTSIAFSNSEAGKDPQWYIDRMVVRDLEMNTCWLFLARKWVPGLEKGEDEGETVLLASSLQQLHSFNSLFVIKWENYMKDRHIWYSLMAMRPWSCHDMTRAQRVACCTLLVFMLMLTSLMFYGQVHAFVDSQEAPALPHLLLGNIITGVESCLLCFPMTYMVAVLFRSSRNRHNQYTGFGDQRYLAPKENLSVRSGKNGSDLKEVALQSDRSKQNVKKEQLSSSALVNARSSKGELAPNGQDISIKNHHERKTSKDVGARKRKESTFENNHKGKSERRTSRHVDKGKRRKDRTEEKRKASIGELAPSRGPRTTRRNVSVRSLHQRRMRKRKMTKSRRDKLHKSRSIRFAESTSSSESTLSLLLQHKGLSGFHNRRKSIRIRKRSRAERQTSVKQNTGRTNACSSLTRGRNPGIIKVPAKRVSSIKQNEGKTQKISGPMFLKIRDKNKNLPSITPSAHVEDVHINDEIELNQGGVTVMDVDPGSVDYKPMPWFCVYIGWVLVTSVVIGCSILSVMYGMTFGYEISKQWLISLLTGILQSIFVLEPMKAVLLAYFVVINNPRLDLTDWIPPLRNADTRRSKPRVNESLDCGVVYREREDERRQERIRKTSIKNSVKQG